MIFDIVLVILIIVFAVLGVRSGFLRGVISTVSTIVAIVLAIVIAKPVAIQFNEWFDVTAALRGLFSEDSPLVGYVEDFGLWLFIILIGIVLFIIIKIVLWLLQRLIKRLKESNRAFNRVDQVLGLFFGLIKFAVYFCIFTSLLMTAEGMFTWLHEWLFEGSTIALWFYETAQLVMGPLIRSVGAEGILGDILNRGG
jgi:uncharacterized membrane protein required for colicin V production